MEVLNRSKLKSFITKDGSRIIDIVSPRNSSARNQSLGEARLRPGKATDEHIHKKSEEIYYLLKGQGLMFIEGRSRRVKAGDAVIIRPGKRHHIKNTDRKELVFLCLCAPAYWHKDTVLI
ncbi:MAG: cupin domain-containing protein [Candidatus Omnitrophica bacterium]|nr:cupin domain-containing protein [Candidatus Omnitrophota bacterium]